MSEEYKCVINQDGVLHESNDTQRFAEETNGIYKIPEGDFTQESGADFRRHVEILRIILEHPGSDRRRIIRVQIADDIFVEARLNVVDQVVFRIDPQSNDWFIPETARRTILNTHFSEAVDRERNAAAARALGAVAREMDEIYLSPPTSRCSVALATLLGHIYPRPEVFPADGAILITVRQGTLKSMDFDTFLTQLWANFSRISKNDAPVRTSHDETEEQMQIDYLYHVVLKNLGPFLRSMNYSSMEIPKRDVNINDIVSVNITVSHWKSKRGAVLFSLTILIQPLRRKGK